MNRKQSLLVLGAVGVVIAAVVLLLVTGGSDSPSASAEPVGDVELIAGPDAPDVTDLADIEFAEVRQEGDKFVFEARLGDDIPRKLKGMSFDLRWDIEATGKGKFLLSGNLDVGPNVALVGIENNFGSSTLDDSLPGEMTIEGNTWTITLDPEDVPDWPKEFTWKLTTSLDGKPGDPSSGRAEDHAPDNGFGSVN